MMRIVYLILAHKAPSQLLRLIEALNDPEGIFVIHVDKQVSISPFKVHAKKSCAKIHFINSRCETSWGSFGLVQASLNGLKFIRRKYKNAQRVILLSGEDYPIKPIGYIKAYLAHHQDTIFMNFFQIPYKKWYQGGVTRFLSYDKISRMIDIYGGSQWLSFPVNVIRVIFDFLKLNEDFLEYYKHGVLIPDESFFQTLFLNCGLTEIIENIVNHNLHLIKWDKPYAHPRVLTMRDKNIIDKSKSLFARKFDSVISLEVLEYLDRNICNVSQNFDTTKTSIASLQPLRSAIILLTDKMNESIYQKYRLLSEVGVNYEVVVLLHQSGGPSLDIDWPSDMKVCPFSNDILSNMGYTPLCDTLVPGSNHFPLLEFYHNNANFDYYWYVEDDVYYNGNWNDFFEFFSQNHISSDFISSHLQDFFEVPKWHWWNTLKHPTKRFPIQLCTRSFNPIYRISNLALKHIRECLIDGWQGHHEVLIPTLLKHYSFSISDFGGTGRYVTSQCKNKFYRYSLNKEELLNTSFRFRPFIKDEEITEPLLYHPVKDDEAKDWQLSYNKKENK